MLEVMITSLLQSLFVDVKVARQIKYLSGRDSKDQEILQLMTLAREYGCKDCDCNIKLGGY